MSIVEFKSTFNIAGYAAVIPKIQNVYPPEEIEEVGYQWGFKYESGTFEYFVRKEEGAARQEYTLLLCAIEDFYNRRRFV